MFGKLKTKIILASFVFSLYILSLSFPVSAQSQVQEVFKVDTKSKVIALTIDDCYHPANVSSILNTLSENNIKATFFPAGYMVLQNPDLFKQAVDLGNQMGNHTYSHKDLTTLLYAEVIDQINTADEILINATGKSSKPYFRPPFFNYNDVVLQALGDLGYNKLMRCTFDSMDWQGISSDEITQNVLSKASPGSIVLFHDTDNTATAFRSIIPSLKDQGYRFVTLAELLSYVSVSGVTMNSTSQYTDIGQKVNLQATVTPSNASEKGLIWSSSNENVAVVDSDGQVTGIAKGTATITATAVDLGFTASCAVEVGDANTNTDINLALGKSVTSSANFANISRITDASMDTANYADGYPSTGLQWVQIDLGASKDVNKIKLWHYFGDSRKYHDVIVQLSDDPTFSTDVTTVFNNDTDDSAGLGTGTGSEYSETGTGLNISFNKVNARYARFYSSGSTANSWNHYVEIEIYGGQTQTDNLAAWKSVTSSTNFTDISRIADFNMDTENYADGYPNKDLQWVQIDLGASMDVNNIKLWHYFGDSRKYHDVIVQLSNDPTFSTRTTVFNNDTNQSAGLGFGTEDEYTETSSGLNITFTTVNARYVRFYSNGSTANNWNHYVEIEIYNIK
jgi:peptidoglycan/xylan/chitin deacetylase (PgdA/CDA1 family)